MLVERRRKVIAGKRVRFDNAECGRFWWACQHCQKGFLNLDTFTFKDKQCNFKAVGQAADFNDCILNAILACNECYVSNTGSNPLLFIIT